jgi:peroxiredoxin
MGDRFHGAGLQPAAISVDPVEGNAALVDKLLLNFPVLSDPEARVIREWDVYNPDEDVAVPSIFLVLPDLTIAYSYRGDDFADRPGEEEIFAALGGTPHA